MKNFKIAIFILLITAAVNAQNTQMSKVSTNVMEIFEKEYPDATDIEWEIDNESYKVEFDLGQIEHEIWYTKDGSILKIEKDIVKVELPEPIFKAIEKNYPGYTIDAAEMTEKNGKKTFEIELEKGWNKEKKIVFDAAGKILSEKDD